MLLTANNVTVLILMLIDQKTQMMPAASVSGLFLSRFSLVSLLIGNLDSFAIEYRILQTFLKNQSTKA